MIDFGVSVFVDSPDTQIEGFVGTTHGPPQSYSPICADLWACGHRCCCIWLLGPAFEIRQSRCWPGAYHRMIRFSGRYSMKGLQLISSKERSIRSTTTLRYLCRNECVEAPQADRTQRNRKIVVWLSADRLNFATCRALCHRQHAATARTKKKSSHFYTLDTGFAYRRAH
jgi:hypothetical protein